MTQASLMLQVTSFHHGSFGGGVLLGHEVASGSPALRRALIPADVLPREAVAGEVWRVSRNVEMRSVFDHVSRKEMAAEHIVASWAGPVAPTGAAIRHWIAKHPDIKGIGPAYANRLWNAHAAELYELLRKRDVAALAKALDWPKAAAIVEAFGLLVQEITLLEKLDTMSLDGPTARAAITLFGDDAPRLFAENPYALTLLRPWAETDHAALTSGMAPDDERRLLAAVDVVAARAWQIGGHTVVDRASLVQRVRPLLGRAAEQLAGSAVALAVRTGDLRPTKTREYQARAPWHIEQRIRCLVAQRLQRRRPSPAREIVDGVIAHIEQEDGLRFEPEQREAVHMAMSSGFSIIAGGAGTGKTTVLKAVMLAARERQQGEYVQIALSGRAAKRLAEATGAPALTVYRFLKDLEHGRSRLDCGLLVIDECSVVSTPDLWRIMEAVPESVDILLAGDPGQLPPIQAGNPTAAILDSVSVPRTFLQVPHRQKGHTEIPRAAGQIREGRCPDFKSFDFGKPDAAGLFIHRCRTDDVAKCVLEVFAALVADAAPVVGADAINRFHAADVQILSTTKMLAEQLGQTIEDRWLSGQPALHDWGFRIGSKILWTKNSYEHRAGSREDAAVIMNGTLGVLHSATRDGVEVLFDDGTVTEIVRADLDRVLRGWAVTVHKAQGSAFRRMIVPITPGRLLDRSLLYTAITRARLAAVLIGDPALIRRRIEAPPTVWNRRQALDIDSAVAPAGDA